MSCWISVDVALPDPGLVVFVRGRPYGSRTEMVALAVRDAGGVWCAPDVVFGWFDGLHDCDPDGMTEFDDDVREWRPLPNEVMDVYRLSGVADESNDDMALPFGKSCRECVHYGWCSDLHGVAASNTVCNFSPSRFGVSKPVCA